MQSPKEFVKVELEGKTVELEVLEGTEGEKAINILPLRKETGYITMDPGYGNTGSCTSSITFLNGEKGILRHRGYPIEQLAEKATFAGVSYLLFYGELPDQAQYAVFDGLLREHGTVDPELTRLIDAMPERIHPMSALSAVVQAMSGLFPDYGKETAEGHDLAAIRLLAKTPAIAAHIYRKSIGNPYIDADPALDYATNFLHMMFGDESEASPAFRKVRAESLDNLLIIHADHEQNCSTSTVRMVNSSNANIFASISSGISALWGPLHGGANQAVMEMLETIQKEGGDLDRVVARAKDKQDPFRLMGFGHRVYKTYDPRAKIAKQALMAFLKELGLTEPLVEIAMQLEQRALQDLYFQERNLYPNVDFYTGILYRSMKIPTELFTVLFAIGRMSGWLAHVMEFAQDPMRRIGRPRQVYTGELKRDFVPRDQR